MKKALSLLMAATIILSASAVGFCESGANAEGTSAIEVTYDNQDPESMMEAVESAVNAGSDAVTTATDALLTAIGDTYDGYSANIAAVEGFYTDTLNIACQIYATLRTISIDYYKCLAAQGLDDYDAWNGAMDDFYEAWDDGMDDFYEVWDGVYEDVYDRCDDAIESASDQLDYSEYSDVWSDMYDAYSDAWSDIYGEHSDAWSDLYGDHSDVWSAFYRGKTDVDDILRLNKESGTSESTGIEMDAALLSAASASTVEEIEELASQGIESTLSALNAEFETMASDIDTYQEYVDNREAIEAFYDKVLATSESLCASMCVFSVDIANIILAADMDKNDMYDELEEIKDCIYDDAADDIYDGIYDGLLEDMNDAFYSGVLEDRDDDIPYADWSGIRSDAYRTWSDARSDAYRQWSDMRSDIYRFCSDLRTAVFRGDIDRAQEKAADFYADYAELVPEAAATQTNEAEAPAPTDVPAPAEEPVEEATEAPASAEGIRPEFKAAMDSYEAFYTEYCNLLAQYKENPTDLGLLAKYGEMMAKVSEMDEAFDEWNEDEMNSEELKYYLDVSNRVMKMLVDAAG